MTTTKSSLEKIILNEGISLAEVDAHLSETWQEIELFYEKNPLTYHRTDENNDQEEISFSLEQLLASSNPRTSIFNDPNALEAFISSSPMKEGRIMHFYFLKLLTCYNQALEYKSRNNFMQAILANSKANLLLTQAWRNKNKHSAASRRGKNDERYKPLAEFIHKQLFSCKPPQGWRSIAHACTVIDKKIKSEYQSPDYDEKKDKNKYHNLSSDRLPKQIRELIKHNPDLKKAYIENMKNKDK